ncbi:MAG: spondin domain-containing protein [Chitinophagaceae bacterium]|nr:spondin domain-containing protein [Chitinophagaceae bacterium]
MKRTIFFIAIAIIISSCKKDDRMVPSSFTEARYTITISGKWSSPAFTVPPGAHYTTFIGMVHNSSASLWKDGAKTSYGIEVLAETGGGGPVLAEIDSTINKGNGLSLLLFVAPSTTSSANVNIYCNSNFSKVSFASMLGPTPDWFVGVSNFDLYRNDSWLADTTVDLYAYDAGTEDGDVFAYNNAASVPQQNIHVLQASQAVVLANGNAVLAPIATVRFRKE